MKVNFYFNPISGDGLIAHQSTALQFLSPAMGAAR